MNRRMSASLMGTALRTGFGLAVLVALIDSFKGWMITGLSPWGSDSQLLILLAGWTIIFLPAALISWLLVQVISRYPRAWSRLEDHSRAVISGVTCGLAFFSVSGLATFRIWLPDNIRLLSAIGVGMILLLGILAVLAGGLSVWIAQRIQARHSRTIRLSYWGLSAIVVLLAIAFSMETGNVALGISSSRKAGDTTRPNIFIILLDALRADALGCYGKSGTETPAIDRLAADGVLYRNAYTTAPWTRPAMASLWTGLYPSTHQVRRGNKMAEGADRLTPNAITLAEYLKESGYQTCGLNTNPVIMPQFGLHQGFDLYYTFPYPTVGHSMLIKVIGAALSRYYTPNHYTDGEVLTDTLIRCLQKPPDEPFLMYAHYMDPHEPYWENPGKTWSRMFDRALKELVEISRQRYQGEVRYLDGNIGKLMQALKNQNLYDQSMIILLADHGEEFFEHGVSGHGDNLTQEIVRIPLIIKFPGSAHAGTVVDDAVSLVDVAPTVMHTAGLQVPSAMQGIILSPQSQPDRNVFVEVGDDDNYMRSVISPEWRLIKRFNRNRNSSTVPDLALFNRLTDPLDLEEVSSQYPDVVTSLMGLMEDHFHRALAESLPREAAEMSPEVQDRMNTLGYLR